MLNIPGSIKDLFYKDHCYKNIRIHFPHGERTDICNDLIVKDSVSFKESLCSRSELKFGLCEASVFECETVGVGNIKDALIEVYCEVECPSTGTGAVWRTDIQKYVYPIPYGTFVVSECQRQSDLNHRRIVAYSGITVQNTNFSPSCTYLGTFLSDEMNAVVAFDSETVKDYVLTEEGGNLTYDPIKRLCAKMNAAISDDITLDSESGADYISTYSINSGTVFSHGTYATVSFGASYVYTQKNNNLAYAEFPELILTEEEIIEGLVDAFYEAYQAGYLTESEYSSIESRTRAWLQDYLSPESYLPISINPCVMWQGKKFTKSGITYTPHYYTEMPNGFWVYPRNGSGNNTYDEGRWVIVGAPARISVTYGPPDARIIKTINIRPINQDIVRKALSDSFGLVTFDQERIASNNSNNRSGYVLKPFDDDYYSNMLGGAFELQGIFGKVGRDNRVTYINIKKQFGLLPESDLYPSEDLHPQGVIGGLINPENYQSCWYDDEYTKPYGAVRCDYIDTNQEACSYTLFFSGYDMNSPTDSYLTYDLTDNYIIRNGTWTQAKIRSICENIAANIFGVQYIPIDYVGRGLPYVEAGDTFEILTKSNDSITTIVLNRTISGEITLTDAYKSV